MSFAAEYRARKPTTEQLLGYPSAVQLLEPLAGANVLDFGAGSGRFTGVLAHKGATVTAYEPDAAQRSAWAQPHSSGRLVDSLDNLVEQESGSFDGAVAAFVYCALPSRAIMEFETQRIASLLRPGGRFVLLEPHPAAYGTSFSSFRRDAPRGVRSGDPVTVRLDGVAEPLTDTYWTKQDYLTALSRAGLCVDTIREPRATNATRFPAEAAQAPFLVLRAHKVSE